MLREKICTLTFCFDTITDVETVLTLYTCNIGADLSGTCPHLACIEPGCTNGKLVLVMFHQGIMLAAELN